jgi:peroxiredoxin
MLKSVLGLLLLLYSACTHPPVAHLDSLIHETLTVYDDQGREVRLSELAGQQGLVLVAQRVDCPIVRKYSAKVEDVRQKLQNNKINLVYLNVTKSDTPEKVNRYKSEFKVATPVYYDHDQRMAKALNMERTSEVVFLNSNLEVKYQGAIDDSQDYEASRSSKNEYLLNAVQNFISGVSSNVSRTEARGCLIE